jgi:hypothetical protein
VIGLSKPLKEALEGFIEGDYAGNRARVVVALRDVGLDEQRAALDYIQSIQTQHGDRQNELKKVLKSSIAYDVLEEITGTRGQKKTGFSDEEIERMAEAKTKPAS